MIASVRCPRLVGRAVETGMLRARLADAERGRGSLTFVSGDAGIGKTRLVGDFLALPDLRRTPRAVGYCMEHARSPLAPLADIIWSLTDEHPGLLVDAPVTRRALSRLVPSLALEGDQSTVPTDARTQYAAIVDLLRRAGEKKPVVILIEDAQWADLSTIDFITFFAGRLVGTHAMMLVMRRALSEAPDPLADSIARVRSNDNVYAISLRPLTIGDMRQLSELALAGADKLPDELLRQVHELADGNPLFAEELLGTALSSPGRSVTLPDSLRSLFLDRFSGLDVDDRETLTEAAVMGRSFDPAFLAQLTGRPIERILRTLRSARELQLVDDEGDGVVFRHALVREALYASLLGAEARRLHRRMAEELETLPETMSRTSALAYHWWSAREPTRAFTANVLAGDRAMGHLATTDAAVFFERALSCTPDNGETRALTECRLGAAYHGGGFPQKAAEAYTRALAFYRTTGDMRKIAEVSLELGRHNAALANGDAALRWRLEALEAAKDVVDDDAFKATAFAHVAWSAVIRGDITSARDYLETASSFAADLPFVAQLDLAEATIFADLFSGKIESAETRFTELSAAANREATTTQVVRAYHNNALLQCLIGNIESALERSVYAVNREDETLAPSLRLSALGIRAAVTLKAGDLASALQNLASAEAMVASFGQRANRFTATLVPVGIGLGLRTGNPLLVERYGDPTMLEEAFTSREYVWNSTLTDLFVAAAAAAGELERARTILGRALEAHSPAPLMPDLALQFAEFATLVDATRASELLARWPADIRPIKAYRALFDAYVARRKGHSGVGLARDAAERFLSLRLPLLAARAYEVAGDEEAALRLYETHGCTGDVARMRGTADTASGEKPALSRRERDVLPHVLRGRSNAEIAHDLNISERTVESHVRSILAKYGVKSRLQLIRTADSLN